MPNETIITCAIVIACVAHVCGIIATCWFNAQLIRSDRDKD